MKRVLIAVGFLAMLTAGSVFATGSTEKAGSGGQKPVTMRFVWWGSDVRHQATLAAIDRYQELHPNITIEAEYQGYSGYLQKLLTQIAGRSEPDIIQLDYIWFPDLATRGDLFVDLAAQKAIDVSPYETSFLSEYCSINGALISLPMGSNGFGININKTFYAKHNISLDTVWTWEKIIETGGKIHRTNPREYLFTTDSLKDFILIAYIYSKTGKYLIDDTTGTIQVSRKDLVDGFTIVKQLFESGAVQPLGEGKLFTSQMEQNPKWTNNEIGFILGWSGNIGKYKAALKGENFAVGKPPFAEGGNRLIPVKPGMVLGISNRSPNIEAAAHFANWLLNDPEAVKILKDSRSVPTNRKAFEILSSANIIDRDIAAMVAFSNASPAASPPLLQSNAELADIIEGIGEQVAFGVLTPEAAADKFLADVQAKLNMLKTSAK
ncbi:MAG: ABC transporter substrate-binding protein [Spirochaetaceae bacterium]|nr:ABC transporter substrate-binding protein [Spirochaetaceae bacterium]